MIRRRRPKVGLLLIGHIHFKVYCDMDELKKRAIQELNSFALDIVDVGSVLYTGPEVIAAVDTLRKNDVDIAILFVPQYFREELIDIIARELDFCPIALWSLASSPDLAAPMLGTLIANSHLVHLRKDFLKVIGNGIGRESAARLAKMAKAAMAAKEVSRAAIAQIGAPNLGMAVTSSNGYSMRKIVPNILYLDTLELVSLFENLKDREVGKLADDSVSKVSALKVKREELEKAIRSYLALSSIIEKYNLDGVAIRDWPELGGKGVTICLAASLLAEKGICVTQESDISCVITSLVENLCGGQAAYETDFGSANSETGVSFLFHEGAMPLSFANDAKGIALVPARTSVLLFHGRETSGVAIEAVGKEGFITGSKIKANPLSGQTAMLILQGEAVSPPGSIPPGRSSFYVRFDCNISNMVEVMTAEGFEHHIVLTYAQIREELEYFAEISGMKKVVPE